MPDRDDFYYLSTETIASEVGSLDLQAEAEKLNAEGVAWVAEKWIQWNTSTIWVLFVPDRERAGVAWGAAAQWTDCQSTEEALDRFFAVNDMEMLS